MKAETHASDGDRSKQSTGAKMPLPKSTKASSKNAKSAKVGLKRSGRSSRQSNGQRSILTRGRDALDHLPQWANRAADALPNNIRKLEMPDTGPVRDYLREKPLILSALGLGIGAVLGTLLPAFYDEKTSRRSK